MDDKTGARKECWWRQMKRRKSSMKRDINLKKKFYGER